ncbi:DNA polymerase V subunit UmuC [Vibrio azureus]|uniref:UmuC protein n=1 Tax=Vibrio azureus NBRC 104587 TaxID=1219077 RepID=U3AWF1_9VIBR|nr:Y-family DNA polymerase [Vibrio azureus]AUI86234.1 DNA polymerase V subunit UmuC [Vibrio azureus]GAD78085.1 UmuC protein [Vibrio azureus NBRC 104587]
MFALVDANAFYCSAEQVFQPNWRGKAIVVLSNNDGCVVAANQQAKAMGVEKFKPYFQMKALCEQRGVIVLSSNYELYADLSTKMMQVIGRFAPEQYIYSIDESFLSFTQTERAIPCLRSHGVALRQAVWRECRLPVCVGMGPTLTLAKVANHAAKKIQGYQGVCVLDRESERKQVLSQLSVNAVWGVGRRLTTHLKHLGITTALQLADYPAKIARKTFNVELERTILELNGQPCKRWDEARTDKKQIFSTRSFGHRIEEQSLLSQALCQHAAIASRKARQQGSLCRVMVAFASSSPFDDIPYSQRAIYRFAYPTADVTNITKVVSQLAKELFKQGVRFYKVGVGLLDLVDGRQEQPDLFNPQPNNAPLMTLFDGLNKRYGQNTLFLGAQGCEQKWQMRRQFLTPQYTTCWSDLPIIRC